MRRYLPAVVVGAVCLATVACQTGAGGLSEQDQAAIRKLDAYYMQTATAANPDWNAAVDLCYAEDAKVLPPNMPAVEGHQAIKAMHAQSPSSFKELRLDIVSLEGRSDLAHEYGAYALATAPSGSSAPVTDRGKYVAVWKKQADGTWKMIRDIYNSDLPVPGLIVPAGAVKSDAGPELKQLDWFVGQWKYEGDAKAGPLGPAGKYVFTSNCQWFPGGDRIVCASDGTAPTGIWHGFTTYSYDAGAKAYTVFDMDNTGWAAMAKGSFRDGNWNFLFDTRAEGKPFKARFALTDTSPSACAWKMDFSMAGGPWTLWGEGKATKVK